MTSEEKETLFNKIYKELGDPIYRSCCYYARNPDDQNDLFQEVLTRLWSSLDKLRDVTAIRTWTFRVTTNTASGDDSLIERIKKSNQQSVRTLWRLIVTMFVAMVIIIVVFFLNPDPELNYLNRLAGGFMTLAFLLYIPFAYKWYARLKSAEYIQSVLKFLEISEMRHRFWNKDSWMLIPYILLIGASMNASLFARYIPESWSTGCALLIVNSAFLVLICFSFLAGYRSWKRKKKPVLTDIRLLMKQQFGEEDH